MSLGLVARQTEACWTYRKYMGDHEGDRPATGLPGCDVFLVTLSQDTDEMLGIADLAIGWFPDRNIFDAACGRVVTRYWRRLAAENGQQEWEAFVSAGRMDEPTVRKWARRVRWAASF